MVRLSSSLLLRVHRFLLEIHAAGSIDALRVLIPQGLSRLIACDRAAWNEFCLDANGHHVATHPVPSYWNRLGPVMRAHATDHRMIDPRARLRAHRAVTFSDWNDDLKWRRSVLYNEYYLSIGVTEQLGTHLLEENGTRVILSCNRARRSFAAADRAVMELVSPHVALACRTAEKLARLSSASGKPAAEATGGADELTIDPQRWAITAMPSRACMWLRRHFGARVGVGARLPEGIARWLAVQLARSGEEKSIATLPQPLHCRRAGVTLTLRVARATPTGVAILVEETGGTSPGLADGATDFTPRESEILHWLGEGKRNSEIGAILGISGRTVGKHLEHLFEKLGVETRTAAVRAAAERERFCQANRPADAVPS